MIRTFTFIKELIINCLRDIWIPTCISGRCNHELCDEVNRSKEEIMTVKYEFIDPEYVEECMVDLESNFKYNIGIDKDNGLRSINIFHDETPVTKARQIEELMEYNKRTAQLIQLIDGVIEKIKLEYPDFRYHIHYDKTIHIQDYQYGGLDMANRKNGTQIVRLTDNFKSSLIIDTSGSISQASN